MRLKITALLIGAFILQLELVEHLTFFDVAPNILLAFIISAGLVGGKNLGLYTGFGLGLAYDLYLPTIFGLSAFVYAILGYLVSASRDNFAYDRKLVVAVVGILGTAFGIFNFVIVGEIFGQDFLWTSSLWKILVIPALFNGPFTLLSTKLMRRKLVRRFSYDNLSIPYDTLSTR